MNFLNRLLQCVPPVCLAETTSAGLKTTLAPGKLSFLSYCEDGRTLQLLEFTYFSSTLILKPISLKWNK